MCVLIVWCVDNHLQGNGLCIVSDFCFYALFSFVADGRFHLEALMIHNPQIANFYR